MSFNVLMWALFVRLTGAILTLFFDRARVASEAFSAELTCKPYYDWAFHLNAALTFLGHAARALYNLAGLVLRCLIIAPLCLLNPLAWLALPELAYHALDNASALTISLASITIHPLIVALRTLSTIAFGYENGSDFDEGEKMADQYFWTAVRI